MAERACTPYVHCAAYSVLPVRMHALRRWASIQSRKLKPRKLILTATLDFSRKLAPPKITRHTVFLEASIFLHGMR